MKHIVSGKIPEEHNNGYAGAMYGYVLKELCAYYGEYLPNTYHSPTSLSDHEYLYMNLLGPSAIMPIPYPDDFPTIMVMDLEKSMEMKRNFNKLPIPEDCSEEFAGWLKRRDEAGGEIVMFYH